MTEAKRKKLENDLCVTAKNLQNALRQTSRAEEEFDKATKALEDFDSLPAVWVPKSGGEEWHYMVSDLGGVGEVCYRPDDIARLRMAIGNIWQTKELALKASEYSKVQGLINQACLNVESDYVPDWFDNTTKWIPLYDALTANWIPLTAYSNAGSEISQSTEAKCLQVCDILNNINLKPVGVK